MNDSAIPQTKASQSTGGKIIETVTIGNRDAGLKQVSLSSAKAVATFIGVRWDGDKVRGIRVELSDGSSEQAGGYGDDRYELTQYRFGAGETLAKAWLRDSGYGYGSVRQVEFVTSTGNPFKAGQGGFDNEVSLAVDGEFLVGFHAWVNPDNFISGLAFIVRSDTPPKPIVQRPWFETNSVGNRAAASSEVQSASDISVARSIAVRWDGDKVRGIRLELRDGTITSAGGIDDVKYKLDSYTFAEDETLQSLSLSSSGYGHGSLRRIEFTTNKGATFAAGPTGIDDLVTPPIVGTSLVGFHAWVNSDDFINALAFRATNDTPLKINVRNYSPWSASFANGVVTVDGKESIRVLDEGGNKHGWSTRHSRVVKIASGCLSGYCAYDGSAPLEISMFGDATFEAKFAVVDGDRAVYGPINDIAPPSDKLVLMDALVRKYAPIFMLNVDEVYWPATVDTFLDHMIIQKVDNGKPSDFFTEPLNRNVLAAQASLLDGNNSTNGACLRTRANLNHPSDTQDWFNGSRPLDPSQVTTYAVVVEGQNNKLDIVYWWFFNYNQGKTVAGTSWGNHLADWEHVKVELGKVDFVDPQQETILGVMYDHHGDQETHAPGDGIAEFSGQQVLVHLSNGDHEAYPKAGVYDLKSPGTHDYCKENAYRFDQQAGTIEIYQWRGADFLPLPVGSPATFKDANWLRYRGRWGNWQRGDLIGLVAQLETGPEGLLRPGEYAQPQ